MKKSYLPLLLLSLLVIMTGCGKEEVKQTIEVSVEDNEKVVESTLEQKSYVTCVQAGYNVSIRFNYLANRQMIYCVLEEDPEWICPASDFLLDECGEPPEIQEEDPYLTAVIQEILEERPRFCEPIAEPICGENSRTYTNACIASQYGITVAYEGPCKPPETPSNIPLSPISAGTKTPVPIYEKTPITTPPTQSNYIEKAPAWLDIPIGLLEEQQTRHQVTISRCQFGNEIYYYQKEDSTYALDMLYDDEGTVVCYPNNDFERSCPNELKKTGIAGCQKVWERY
ncbi:MAG: hypothetical protein HOE80_01635 [Candidatus Magasanikbacteria bacterium]|nr:hypothetical protein [Candidatus Magasanikbacteria bacterium]MBT4071403.1 hypothetical protein [Candidatus Magasanikbacteria bacterium]